MANNRAGKRKQLRYKASSSTRKFITDFARKQQEIEAAFRALGYELKPIASASIEAVVQVPKAIVGSRPWPLYPSINEATEQQLFDALLDKLAERGELPLSAFFGSAAHGSDKLLGRLAIYRIEGNAGEGYKQVDIIASSKAYVGKRKVSSSGEYI